MGYERLSDALSIRNGRLFIEDCDATELAEHYGTPLFVVSEDQAVRNFKAYRNSFQKHWPEGPVRVMAAIKANPITAIRRALTREGCGCDTFGFGELECALRGGVPHHDIAVNGSIKSPEIIRKAIELGCHIVLDSQRELTYCEEQAAELGKKAQVMLRVKPYLEGLDLPSDFFPQRLIRDMTQTVKYGIPTSEMLPMVPKISDSEHVELIGVHMHTGRHSKDLLFWTELVKAFAKWIHRIREGMGDEWTPKVVSFGGGMAAGLDRESRVAVTDYDTPSVDAYAEAMCSAYRDAMVGYGFDTGGMMIEVEPGRAMLNEAGIHLTKVHVVKHETENIDRKWLETDTSEVFLSVGSLNVESPFDYVVANKADLPETERADIVGITCNYECLAEQAPVPSVESGDVIAFLNTGSYIEVYSCNFNCLPRPGTVLVKGEQADLIKRAETIEDVFARDVVPERLAGAAAVSDGSPNAKGWLDRAGRRDN
jgi:diaminopimelate decarboxylase